VAHGEKSVPVDPVHLQTGWTRLQNRKGEQRKPSKIGEIFGGKFGKFKILIKWRRRVCWPKLISIFVRPANFLYHPPPKN